MNAVTLQHCTENEVTRKWMSTTACISQMAYITYAVRFVFLRPCDRLRQISACKNPNAHSCGCEVSIGLQLLRINWCRVFCLPKNNGRRMTCHYRTECVCCSTYCVAENYATWHLPLYRLSANEPHALVFLIFYISTAFQSWPMHTRYKMAQLSYARSIWCGGPFFVV